jgi:outer membrane lipoprotein carrier protein
MRTLLVVTALGAVALAPHGSAGAQSADSTTVDATVDKAVQAYANVRTVRATFEQTITNPLTGTTATARGELQQQRPNLLSVRFTDPGGDRIVADGTALWVYLPSTNPGQAIRMPLGETGAGVDLTAQFLDAPKTQFTITDAGSAVIGGRSTRALTLVPKTNRADFSRATVWVDTATGRVPQFEVTDANGLVRRVRLTNVRLNAPVDPTVFRFSPPAGVKVFDQTN